MQVFLPSSYKIKIQIYPDCGVLLCNVILHVRELLKFLYLDKVGVAGNILRKIYPWKIIGNKKLILVICFTKSVWTIDIYLYKQCLA